jgi:hypothetical protein
MGGTFRITGLIEEALLCATTLEEVPDPEAVWAAVVLLHPSNMAEVQEEETVTLEALLGTTMVVEAETASEIGTLASDAMAAASIIVAVASAEVVTIIETTIVAAVIEATKESTMIITTSTETTELPTN